MKTLSATGHDLILRHILYGLLTRWIPVPFADEIAGNLVRRQMVRGLAKLYAVELPSDAVKSLADDRSRGCVYGCLVNILFFPVKPVLGKLMLILRSGGSWRWQGGTTTRSA